MNQASKAAKWVGNLGLILYSGPVWGKVGHVIGMMKAYETLRASESPSPAQLAGDIQTSLLSMGIGLVAGLAGLILILIARHSLGRHGALFFGACLLLSASWCFCPFPYGAIVGLPMLVVLILQKESYLGRRANQSL